MSLFGPLWGRTENPTPQGQGFARASARPGARSTFKVRGVEGWRGVACLIVVGYHVWQNMDDDGDGLGPVTSPDMLIGILSLDVIVDLFFVLSGLLLFLPFAHAALHDDQRIPPGREFLFRRCVRLFPVYWVLVVLCWSTRNFGFETAQWKDLLLHLTLLQSFDSETIFWTIGPAWTLSLEWVFYVSLALFAPMFVRWVRLRPTPSQRIARMLTSFAAVALLSALYKLNVQLVWQIPVTDWAWRFGPAAKADDFAIGMALAVVMVALRGRTIPVFASAVAFGAGAALLYVARSRVNADPDAILVILRHPVAAAGWTFILFAVMACRSHRPAAWVDNRLFVRISILAYTIYLVHEPVILMMEHVGLLSMDPSQYVPNLLAAVALTVGAAWVLHRAVEEPWVDVAALQAKGGGRRDLYAEQRGAVRRTPAHVRADRRLAGALRAEVLVHAGRINPHVVVRTSRAARDEREKVSA